MTATWLLAVPLRLFLAAGWLRAAAEKAVDAQWLCGDGVRSFLTTERPVALPFLHPVMDSLLQPCAAAVAVVVLLGEILCGLAIVTGRALRLGLWTGVALNVAFVACGRVNPSAFYLVMELILLFAIADGAVGRSSRRLRVTPAAAIVATLAGLAMLPFVRTVEPADVIADPAAMLAFLGLIVGLGNAVRWAADQPLDTNAHRMAARVITWSRARPPLLAPGIERAALPFNPQRPHAPHPLLRPSLADELGRRPAMNGDRSTA